MLRPLLSFSVVFARTTSTAWKCQLYLSSMDIVPNQQILASNKSAQTSFDQTSMLLLAVSRAKVFAAACSKEQPSVTLRVLLYEAISILRPSPKHV